MPLTGVYEVDVLIGETPRDWIVEFYGDHRAIHPLLHQTAAYQSRRSDVLLVHSMEFGGLDPYLLYRLARRSGGSIDRIHVSRGFRLNDVAGTLESIDPLGYGVVILAYPYRYIPGNPAAYMEASRITGLVKKLSLNHRVIVFNEVAKNGGYYPDGGSLHHHTVHVIVGLWMRHGGRITARLFKHPSKPLGETTSFTYKRLLGGGLWVEQHRLTEWLYIRS